MQSALHHMAVLDCMKFSSVNYKAMYGACIIFYNGIIVYDKWLAHVCMCTHLLTLTWPPHDRCIHMQCAVTKATCLELKKPQNCFCVWCDQAVLQVREKGTVQSHSLLQHNVVHEPLQHCVYLWYTSQPTHTITAHTYCTLYAFM